MGCLVVINCDFAMVVAVIDENDLLDDMKRLKSYFLSIFNRGGLVDNFVILTIESRCLIFLMFEGRL